MWIIRKKNEMFDVTKRVIRNRNSKKDQIKILKYIYNTKIYV